MTLLALLLSIIPYEGVAVESVDAVERNWVVGADGDLRLCQLIFYDVDLNTGELRVREWRRVQLDICERDGVKRALAIGPQMLPRMIWDDGGVIRDLRVGYTTETLTEFDPERHALASWPENWRRRFMALPQPRTVLGRRR